MTRSSIRIPLAALALFLASPSRPALAGCGCDKAPPAPASVRPTVTYAGMPVSLFSSTFTVGSAYTVVFTGITGTTASVNATVVSRRDIADGTYKPQIVVNLPVLPLGPASITATRSGATQPELTIADSNFTVAPTPVAVPYAYGYWQYPNSQAAVSRGGVTYVSLDLSGVTYPLIFNAWMGGYPLRFAASNVTFYNTQGFLMQLLINSTTPVAGMFVNPNPTAADSNVLWYSRHEFNTYFLQHLSGQPRAVDGTDPNWHVDGTRHVDHNHVILAITGKVNGTTVPAAGATPAFNLMVKAESLFFTGITGTGSVTMSTSAITDSLDSNTNLFGSHGDVFTQGILKMTAPSTIQGSATAKTFTVPTTGVPITGTRYTANPSTTFLAITVPTGLASLGAISMSSATTRTIYGPGSYLVTSISLSKGATLFIDNSAGPVTLYVTGAVTVSGATIATADPKPDKFSMYVASTSNVSLTTTTSVRGVIYAPSSTVALSGTGSFTGALFGKALTLGSSAKVHYDSSMSGNF